MLAPLLRIGSRGSPLALAQSELTRALLAKASGESIERFPLTIIKTTGDKIQDRALSESGGKGLFTKEIDEAQLANEIDVSVHSGKDLPTVLPDGLIEAGFLAREDVRDAFIGHKATRLMDLPLGAKLGTASLRRGAQALLLRPDLVITLFRGNVETRLRKVADGEVDGTLLAMAGLNRLGLTRHVHEILPVTQFLPAVAQGAIGIVIRKGDHQAASLLETVLHGPTTRAATAERRFLRVLDGSCRTPIAALASEDGDDMTVQAQVLSPDGRRFIQERDSGSARDAAEIGQRLGHTIKAQMPADFFHA